MPHRASLHSISIHVADNISAMLAYWDKDLVCRFANAAYSDWFGKTREEMLDKMTLPELLGPELFARNFPYVRDALKGETQTFEREIPVPGGKVRHAIANYFPDIVEGEVRGFFVHVADVTPIIDLQKELKRSNEIVKDQNARLFNFANIVSHNLRSYANNLHGLIALLDKSEAEVEKEKLLGMLKTVFARFSSTVNDLAEIVEVQNQKDAALQRLSLDQCILHVLSVLQLEIGECQAAIHNHVPAGTFVSANLLYLESIVLNMLSNAIKYRSLEKTCTILLSVVTEGDFVTLKITDNGLGIDLAKHGKELFGMYKTFHGNKNAHGMGLFLTRLQIESMGGSVDVTSEPGKGSCFSMTFRKG